MLIKRNILTAALCLAAPLLANAQLAPKDKLTEALTAIKKNYVDSLADQTLVDAAIRGMFTELDPHSKYFSKAEAKEMQTAMGGSFVGIGIEYMMQNDTCYITQILPDGPAEKAGLMTGDRITGIDKKGVAGVKMTNMDILKMIRGEKKTTVAIQVYRPAAKKAFDYSIVRGPVADHSITAAYMLNKETGYIAIRIFSATTRNEMENALIRLKKQGMQQLILDLQGNGGGYVEAALGVADEFLKQNQLVYYTVSQDKGKDYYYASASGTSFGGKLVVLVDQSTASASELLAGALQDWDRAVLLGRRSYGKGLTQRPVALSDGSVLELTGGRLYTPAGRNVQKPYKGVNYQADIPGRYTSGELFHEPTIKHPDSLTFKTLVNKRTVYGGSGITPDKFVPLDTLQQASWLKLVGATGMIESTSWQIADGNREQIKTNYSDVQHFSEGYQVPQTAIAAIVKKATAKGWQPEKKNKAQILVLLAQEIKAQIAGQLYGGHESYLYIINQSNNCINQAVQLLQNPQLYTASLESNAQASPAKKME